MVSDSQVVLDVDVPKVMLVREKAKSTSGIWRTCGVLLAVALCATAAVCFALHQVRVVTVHMMLLYSVLMFYLCCNSSSFSLSSFHLTETK